MRRKGLTLPELAIVIAIIGVLVTLSFPVYRVVKAKLNSAACVGNLKSLHSGMSVYLQDHDLVWPQMPDDEESDQQEQQASADTPDGGGEEDDNGEETHWEWWYQVLKPYGIPKKTWVCPADRDGMELIEDSQAKFIGSYVPSMFDALRNTAYRWDQPWFIERGENHGRQGPNMIYPNADIGTGVAIKPEKPQ